MVVPVVVHENTQQCTTVFVQAKLNGDIVAI